LYRGIAKALPGKHLGDISAAIQKHAEENGFGVVRELSGHGIGRKMHEDPPVFNFGQSGSGIMLKEGMCIAIEPMITLGDRKVWLMPDKWGIITRDLKPAAHFEHTIAIHRGNADILSSFEEIEKIIGE
jgi:methionyl aminopeptidase